jgi:hypothetical protein
MHRSSRQEPLRWQVRGAVVSVGDMTVDVRHKTGQVVTLLLDGRTTYERGHAATDRTSLRRGARVTVDVESTGRVNHAVHVELFGGGT